MEQTKKSLRKIIDDVNEDANYQLAGWQKDTYYNLKTPPPSILAVTEQLCIIQRISQDMDLPMSLLNRIATTLSTSEDIEKAVIGGVLLQCRLEIKNLTDFCRSLASKEVDYPVQDTKDALQET